MDDIFEATGHTDHEPEGSSMPEPDLKLTMVHVWGELNEFEKKQIAHFMGIHEGQLALTKISSVLTTLVYNFLNRYNTPVTPYPGTHSIVGSSAPYAHPGGTPNYTIPMQSSGGLQHPSTLAPPTVSNSFTTYTSPRIRAFEALRDFLISKR